MNIQFLKQNIYILHDVIFINDKKRYIGCHPIIYKTWHHSVPLKHNITDIYVGSLERKEWHFSCHMCTFIGIQEEVQFFMTFLTHLFYVFPHLCQAVDAINSQVFLQVYRKITLLIVGCLIAGETACPIKILTSFRRNLDIRREEKYACSRNALIVAALAAIWDRCIIMECHQQKSTKEIRLLL